MKFFFAIFAAAVCAAGGLADAASNVPRFTTCPLLPGRPEYHLADREYCDRFHVCSNGYVSRTLQCRDGFVFNGDECILRHTFDCGVRTKLQPTTSSDYRCPRANGNFPVANKCDTFYSCQDGIATETRCSSFLVFNEANGVCERPGPDVREECQPLNEYGFECPKDQGVYRLYRAHGDCRAFFSCTAPHFVPVFNGCPAGQVLNEEKLKCDDPRNVPGCENYYRDLDPELSFF